MVHGTVLSSQHYRRVPPTPYYDKGTTAHSIKVELRTAGRESVNAGERGNRLTAHSHMVSSN